MTKLTVYFLAAFTFGGFPGQGSANPQNPVQAGGQNKPEAKSAQIALTGCVDEQEGNYILLDPSTIQRKLAILQADGFPQEGFAKHLGQKVTVRGRMTGVDSPVMKVRSVETLAAQCSQPKQ